MRCAFLEEVNLDYVAVCGARAASVWVRGSDSSPACHEHPAGPVAETLRSSGFVQLTLDEFSVWEVMSS